MNIWHVGAAASAQQVDGVNNTVWLVAKNQALQCHKVGLVVSQKPDTAALELAKEAEIELIHIPLNNGLYNSKILKEQLDLKKPQLVHMHSVFVPKQALLAKSLTSKKIPYIITPHGGLESQRGTLKKQVYGVLIEKKRFSGAAAITILTPREEETVRRFVPKYPGIVRWVSNPINIHNLEGYSWQGNIEAKDVVFLGRFDVLHKGLDILVEIGRSLPEVEFHLYGNEDSRTRKWLLKLQQQLPRNVHFHQPIFGSDKIKMLVNASLYIQSSRWEGFPISVAEAMYLGLPCAVSKNLGFAEIFRKENLGLVLPSLPQEAASKLSQVFYQPTQLKEWSNRARIFALEQFNPPKIAQSYLKLYQEVLDR